MIMCCHASILGKSITLDGIKYTLRNDNTISCSAGDKKGLVDVRIPSTINIVGFQYYVTTVEKSGFEGCKNLRSIEFGNSIVEFGPRAFFDCSDLESVVMPDEAVAKIFTGNYGYREGGIFLGCKNLSNVRGNTVLYPRYVLYDCFRNCSDTPFYATIQQLGAANMVNMQMKRKFTDFTLSSSKEEIEKWQRRKEYETVAQWEARVNDANRRKMIEEAGAAAKARYLKLYSPTVVKGIPETYNKEFGFFPINLGEWGMVYADVPEDEASGFEDKWSNVKIIPTFGIIDDEIGVLSCKFEINGRIYNSLRDYEEDDLTLFAQRITPLASLKEYEQLMATSLETIKGEKVKYLTDEIDIDIPDTADEYNNCFVVIIGNENYQRVAPVEYAMNDARIFEKYCHRTLGIPEKNIRTYYDATYGDIVAAMEDIKNISDAFNGDLNVIFYYAGHGIPNEKNRNAYLLPIDATGTQLDVCYPLDKLYGQLGELNAHKVIAFLDACFSGSLRGEGMLASARGIKLRPKDVSATGNLIVLSATSGDQSAYPYHEKNHGLFSYYLLKKLQETNGDVTLGSLSDYIISNVSKQSVVENQKPQTPSLKFSDNLSDTWRNIPLK